MGYFRPSIQKNFAFQKKFRGRGTVVPRRRHDGCLLPTRENLEILSWGIAKRGLFALVSCKFLGPLKEGHNICFVNRNEPYSSIYMCYMVVLYVII